MLAVSENLYERERAFSRLLTSEHNKNEQKRRDVSLGIQVKIIPDCFFIHQENPLIDEKPVSHNLKPVDFGLSAKPKVRVS